jgi:hypothetical protein
MSHGHPLGRCDRLLDMSLARFSVSLLLTGWVVVSTAGFSGRSQSQAVECDGKFHLVQDYDDGRYTEFMVIDALSANEVWAVGAFEQHGSKVFIVRWDGSAWTPVSAPGVDNGELELTDIEVLAPDNVWVSGFTSQGTKEQPALYRWDGARWESLPVDTEELVHDAPIDAMHVISDVDAWAVGEYETEDGNLNTLTLHWDGTAWNHVDAPSPGRFYASLYDVTATSATDVWALGEGPTKPLALHWDGAAWTRLALPQHPDAYYSPYMIDAVAPDDVWAVGDIEKKRFRALVMHWNGTDWSKVKAPHPGGNEFPTGFDAVSATDVWVVGHHSLTRVNRAFAQRWNGVEWSPVHVDRVPIENQLLDVSALPNGEAWAVGDSSENTDQKATIFHLCPSSP